MEVKPGYKQSEIGVIPEEWDTQPCSEVSERIMVGIVIRPTQYYVANGVPAFRSANIREDGINDLDLVFISNESNAVLAKSQTRTGDVLTVRTGYPGTSAVVHSRHEGCNCIDILITRPSKKVDSEWLAIWINSPLGKEQVLRNQGGLAQKHFNVGDMRNLVVALPPLLEQRTIATALSDVDGLLGGLDRLIAKKRNLKQAAMQQLLTGRTRLPGFHGEWEVKRLGDVGEISSAGVDKKIYPDEVPVRLVNYLDVYHKDFIYSKDLNHWVTAPPPQAKRCAVQKGDVFFTPTSETRDDIGLSAVAMEDIPDAAYSYHVARLRLREPWDLCFRTYAFKTRAFLDQAETLCDGNGTRYVISQGKFKRMIVQVPPIPEQTAIAEVLTEMDAELAVLEQRREKTRALKQAMMQELLTGRIRLVGKN